MRTKRKYGGTLRRFVAPAVRAGVQVGLRDDHPAVVEGRTLFPSSVTGTWESTRFLVSGANNPKLGAKVVKGPRAGWPIYHLTLEERATCPRSCPVWAACYGNGMPHARRHTPDEDFIPALKAEVVTLARAHPGGFLVRLHTLGDFYSTRYVQAWADMLDTLPELHVFGFTARSEDDDDRESRRTALAVRWLTEQAWDRFAIRFSRPAPVAQGSVVVSRPSMDPAVIMCPAQTEATDACATCGLCWAAAARSKAIGFLAHGRDMRGPDFSSNKNSTEIPKRGPGRPRKHPPIVIPGLDLDRARRRLAEAGDSIARKALERPR